MSAASQPWRDARVRRWALFDVATSTYIALVPGFFGLYFTAVLGAGDARAGALWGATAAVAVLAAALLAPVAGAWADRRGGWVAAISVSTILCVLATALLAQSLLLGMVGAALVFVLAQMGYTVAVGQYDALLVRVAAPGQRSVVSTLAWAAGLGGGIVALVAALWLVSGVPAPQQLAALPGVFLLAALLLGVFALPALVALRALVPVHQQAPQRAGGLALLRDVWATCRQWRRHRTAFVLLAGFFLVNDVLVTLQFFGGIVLRERFAMDLAAMLWLSLLFHLVALPSTVIAGGVAGRLGSARAMALMCVLLGAAVVLLALGTAAWAPPLAVVLLGLVFAPLQALFRALFAAHVPPMQMAELFGFNAVVGRLSAALGPLLFGLAAALLGSAAALLLLLLPLAGGAVILLRVGAGARA